MTTKIYYQNIYKKKKTSKYLLGWEEYKIVIKKINK